MAASRLTFCSHHRMTSSCSCPPQKNLQIKEKHKGHFPLYLWEYTHFLLKYKKIKDNRPSFTVWPLFYFPLQSVWKAQRSTASVTWPTLLGNATMPPARTATTWAVSSARPRPATRTTSSETTSARASAKTRRSGWASMTWRPRVPGWTRAAWASHTKTGTRPAEGPLSPTAAPRRTAPSCPGPPAGSGSMRTVERRSLPSASSTLFDYSQLRHDWLRLVLAALALAEVPRRLLFLKGVLKPVVLNWTQVLIQGSVQI